MIKYNVIWIPVFTDFKEIDIVADVASLRSLIWKLNAGVSEANEGGEEQEDRGAAAEAEAEEAHLYISRAGKSGRTQRQILPNHSQGK